MIKYVQNKPIRYERIQELLNLSIQAHTFTNGGPVKQLLEKKLTELFKLDSGWRIVCTNNGTAALYVLMQLHEKLADRCIDDEAFRWATPSFNFPAATVNRLETHTFDIDLSETETEVEYSIPTENFELYHHDGYVIPTLFGTVPKNLDKVIKWCEDNKRLLILDNASSPLTSKESKNINTFGSASIGSAHHTKFLGFGEAGFAVIPADQYDLYTKLTNFGFSDERKHSNYASNAKISDISAAFVLAHIENYDVEKHLTIQKYYLEALSNIKNVKVLASPGWDIVYGNMPVVFSNPINHLIFRDVGIEANKYYKPLSNFSNSQKLYDRIVNLPLHTGLTEYDLNLILKKIETEAKK